MTTLENGIVNLAIKTGDDVANLRARIGALANLGTVIKTDIVQAINEIIGNQGDLSLLTTTSKTSLVLSINEVVASLSSLDLTSIINDAASTTTTDKTLSVSKINQLLITLKSDILGGVPATTLDTIKEIADWIATSESVTASFIASLGLRVRVDETQSFTDTQKGVGRSNIAAVGTVEFNAFKDSVGDTGRDFVATYNLHANATP
jgi:hypothetical protein